MNNTTSMAAQLAIAAANAAMYTSLSSSSQPIERKEKKKLTKKEKLQKYIATLLVASTLTTGGCVAAEKFINHAWERCPLDFVLGIEHQMKHINEKLGDEYIAILVSKGELPLISNRNLPSISNEEIPIATGWKFYEDEDGTKRGIFTEYWKGNLYYTKEISSVDYDRVFVYRKSAIKHWGTTATPIQVFSLHDYISERDARLSNISKNRAF